MQSKEFVTAMEDMVLQRKTKNWHPQTDSNSGTGGNNVLTGFIDNAGKKDASTYPCHAPIMRFKKAEVLWSCFGWRGSQQVARDYFDWLCNESPWARTDIIPDLTQKFMFTEGFVWDSLGKTPANLLHNFLVASRSAAEWPVMIQDWHDLVNIHGFNPSFAYAMLTTFCSHSGHSVLKPDGTSYIAYVDKYDWPLDMARAGDDYINNFLDAKTVGLSSRFFFPDAVTRPVNALWGKVPELANGKNSITFQISELYAKSHGIKREPNKAQLIRPSTGSNKIEPMDFTGKAVLNIFRLEQKRIMGE